MSWFESKGTKEKKSALKNAVAVMLADGQISPNEVTMLAVICRRVGLDPKELKKILDNPQKVKFVVPQDNGEKVMQLVDVVFMMMADGKIDQKEMDLCRTMAMGFGFSSSIVDNLLTTIAEAIAKGKDRGQTVNSVLQSVAV